jgi:hypothetical protein
MQIVHKLIIGDEALYPDYAFASDLPALTELTFSSPGLLQSPSGGDPGPVRATPAFAGAMAAGMALLGSGRVVGLIWTGRTVNADRGGTLEDIVAVIRALSAPIRATTNRSQGPPAVDETCRLADTVADRLRLTSTQRSLLTDRARSAAIRSATVPEPLLGAPDAQGSKAANREVFHDLIVQLEAWHRVSL